MAHQGIRKIGSRIEPLVDDFLIDRLEGTEQVLHHPERREVVLECNKSWESDIAGFNSIVTLEDRIRLYYRASIDGNTTEDFQRIAVAESYDNGLSFVRPDLDMVEFEGSRKNNLIAIGEQPIVPPPFIDMNPACRENERFKGLMSKWRKLFAMASADGLNWSLMQKEELEMEGTFDTINTAFWDPHIDAYRSFTRFFEYADADAVEVDLLGAENTAIRCIQSSTSENFIDWTAPIPHAYSDSHSYTQLYTNATVPCPGAGHILLSFPNRYVQHRISELDHKQPGVNDALFMCSRDGTNWTRYLDAWVRPGLDSYNWTDRNNYPTWGIVETSASEWSMYISEHYRRPGIPARLRRLSVRPHGFVSIRAGYDGGSFSTSPLQFDGDDLYINASTSAAGSIRVAVLDEHGQALDGYGRDNMDEFFGDSLEQRICWHDGKRLGQLANRPVVLSFFLKDADLYAIRSK